MPVCHRRKLKMIHVPKTGGTAVIGALGLERIGYHDSWSVYPSETASYVSFTVVRDPLARFVSQYNFGMSKRTDYHIQGTRHEFPDYHVMKVMSLEQLLDDLKHPWDKRRLKQCGWWPQSWFICDAENRVRVDFVLHQEALQEELDEMLAKLGLPKVTLGKVNRSEKLLAADDVRSRPELLSRLVDIYERDYQVLGYPHPLGRADLARPG